ncbi:MAG: endonuclease III [Spirochaetia bacterium]|jgi:endonuclease-3|nr:endonuclease III [Spirochaetia bacterium]
MSQASSIRVQSIYDTLVSNWPDEGSALMHHSCFELLVSVILSAQCTDEQVNKATPALFEAYPDPASLAAAEQFDVESLIRTIGFYRMKAANIIATAGLLCTEYGNRVPDTIDELVKLPGVGRKTANLIVSVCYGKPGIVVDTHVLRTARRLGLAPTDNPARSERMIGSLLPESKWTAFSYALNRHGKYVCKARKPLCTDCPLALLCPSAFDF